MHTKLHHTSWTLRLRISEEWKLRVIANNHGHAKAGVKITNERSTVPLGHKNMFSSSKITEERPVIMSFF